MTLEGGETTEDDWYATIAVTADVEPRDDSTGTDASVSGIEIDPDFTELTGTDFDGLTKADQVMIVDAIWWEVRDYAESCGDDR